MKHLALITVLFSGPALSAASPEEAARAYVDALIKQDWHAASGQFKADDLKQIRSAVAIELEQPGAEMRRRIFFSDLSLAQINALTDLAFCEKLFFHYYSCTDANCDGVRMKEYSMLGAVPDGPNTHYVIMKQKFSFAGEDRESIELVRTVRDSDQWYVAVPKEFEQLIESSNQQSP